MAELCATLLMALIGIFVVVPTDAEEGGLAKFCYGSTVDPTPTDSTSSPTDYPTGNSSTIEPETSPKKKEPISYICRRYIIEPKGSFNSTDCRSSYGDYLNNSLYGYSISTVLAPGDCPELQMDIDTHVLGIEYSDGCSYDSLEIVGYDVDKICGQNKWVNKTVKVDRGESVQIRFTADSAVTGEGFEVFYSLYC